MIALPVIFAVTLIGLLLFLYKGFDYLVNNGFGIAALLFVILSLALIIF